jgi:hypothetical protein
MFYGNGMVLAHEGKDLLRRFLRRFLRRYFISSESDGEPPVVCFDQGGRVIFSGQGVSDSFDTGANMFYQTHPKEGPEEKRVPGNAFFPQVRKN